MRRRRRAAAEPRRLPPVSGFATDISRFALRRPARRTEKQIAVNTITGGTRNFPEADCTCPVILGTSIANLSGGNMKGSCDPPEDGKLWSTYQARPDIPQALTNWVPHLPEDAAPPQICPGRLNRQYTQCFSFS